MHLTDIKPSRDYTSVQSLEAFFKPAIQIFFDLHDQLAQLPKNPYKDDTPSLHGDMKELELSFGTDCSMFLMGGMEQIMVASLAGVFGVAASAPLVQAAEFGAGMMAEARNDNGKQKSLKSAFEAPAKRTMFKMSAPKPAATNMMQASMKKIMQEKQYKQYLQTLKRRHRLMSDLTVLKDKMHELNLMKKDGMTHAVLSADGTRLDGIVSKPRLTLEAERLARRNKPATPEAAWSAPALKAA